LWKNSESLKSSVAQGTPRTASVAMLCAVKHCMRPAASSRLSARFPVAQIVAEAKTAGKCPPTLRAYPPEHQGTFEKQAIPSCYFVGATGNRCFGHVSSHPAIFFRMYSTLNCRNGISALELSGTGPTSIFAQGFR